jgi:hypothetical protein
VIWYIERGDSTRIGVDRVSNVDPHAFDQHCKAAGRATNYTNTMM